MKGTLRHRHLGRRAFSNCDIGREKPPACPSFEALESRVLLSGSVVASVSGGNLDIQGDNAANAIVLDQSGLNADQVRITGAGGTAINSQADAVILSGVTRGIAIRMGGGADSVTMNDMSLAGDVSVNDKGNADILTLNSVDVAGTLKIQNNTNTLADTTVGKDLMILPGSAGQNLSLLSVEVARNTKFLGGNGADTLTIDDSIFHRAVQLRTGQGTDIIQIEGAGDPLGPPTLFEGQVSIMLSGGDDTLQVGVAGQTGSRSVFDDKARFDGGNAHDILLNFDGNTYTGALRLTNFESNNLAPQVSSSTPPSGATNVSVNQQLAVTFSSFMDPSTITRSTFTLKQGKTPIAGTVTYVGTTATFAPTAPLAASTTFTATVTTGAKDLAGNALASSFAWTFTTGSTADTAAPTISSTDPANEATDVALNKKIAAAFSEAIDPLTVNATSFIVTGPGATPVAGTVTYVGTTATFAPTDPLAASTTFTASVTTGAKDLAGNALASTFAWTFTTGVAADTTAPTVTSTDPADLQSNVALNKTIAATFSESVDPLTVTTATFTVTGPGNTPVTGTMQYDALSRVAAFTPSGNLAPDTTYTATIIGGANGVKDLAGNAMENDLVWTFATGTQVAQAPINLGSAAAFAVMATASIQSTGATQINGDVGLNPGASQGIPPAQVNGTIHVTDQTIITAQADLGAAYDDALSRTVTSVSLPGNMGGLTFAPGLYTNSTSVLISGAGPGNNVTLDAQGDPNAIFIFQMGSTLTTGPGAQVILAGGAKAGNVFWQVGTSATLDTTTIFKGNILAAVSITVNTGSVVEGRLLGGSSSDGSVTVNASTVTVPLP